MSGTPESGHEQLVTGLNMHRSGLRAYMLDTDVAVYDRISMVLGLHRGTDVKSQYPGDSDESRHLRQAAEGHPVLVDTLGGLALGYLNRENPWSIDGGEQPTRASRQAATGLWLVANFSDVRIVDHMHRVGNTSYAGGGSGWEGGPDVREAEARELKVKLDPELRGDENFANRLRGVSDRVAIGFEAIHARVNERPDAQRLALHTAVTMAAVALAGAGDIR